MQPPRRGYPAWMAPQGVAPPPSRGSRPLAITLNGRRTDACTASVQPALAGAWASNLRVIQGVTATKLAYPPAAPGGSRPTAVSGVG